MKSFDEESLALLGDALKTLDRGFADLPGGPPEHTDLAAMRAALTAAAERLHDNYPYHHPLYVGQMLKPPHPLARAAYALALWLNPNNHALDGGRASSAMEKEAVADIARMFGWETHLGHLCGGGTVANCEALWVARELDPGKTVVASEQAHYTHSRLAGVLGMPFRTVAVDSQGRLDPGALEGALERDDVGLVVATLGTTAAGTVDPLPEILELRRRFGFRLHVDAAYGGYFRLARNLAAEARSAFERIGEADSIVVDPHKHGLQPYGCGCVLFRDPAVGRVYRHDSPYTYFTSSELHLGEISLECSRPGAAAVALWTTMRALPLEAGGEFALGLESCRQAAVELHAHLARDARFVPILVPELDIVVWGVRAPTARRASALAQSIFDAAAQLDLHLALAEFPRPLCEPAGVVDTWDAESLTCLRACMMKPEHGDWSREIVARLDQAARRALKEAEKD